MSSELMTVNEKLAWANELAKSAMLPAHLRGKPNDLLWSIAMAEAMGVPPMTAIVGIHSINGKPVASADLMAAVVRRAGHRLRVTSTDKECLAQVVRGDDLDFTFESRFTWQRAEQAKLTGKDTWKQYPAAMLRARAVAEVCRMACPEALLGVYAPEELDDGVVPAPAAQPKASRIAGNIAAAAAARQLPAPAAEPVPAPEQPDPLPAEPEKVGFTSDGERKAFMAQLTEMGWDYASHIRPWLIAAGKPTASQMPPSKRSELLHWIGTEKGRGVVGRWLAAQTPAPPAEVPLDDGQMQGFHDD